MSTFNSQNIILESDGTSVEDVILSLGKLLVDNGYVDTKYVDAMLQRELVIPTYVGNGVAVPHGITGSEALILKSGISFIRIPKGVVWNGDNEVKIAIGIAGKDGTHMDILGKIAMVCSEEENVEKLLNAQSAEEIINIFEEYAE